MRPAMLEGRRCIASHAEDADYAPPARALLWKLGYALLPAADAESPELRIVRDDRLGAVSDPAAPVILLTGDGALPSADTRVVGAVRRPAGLHEIFRLLQSTLEERPRSVPRVSAGLVARAARGSEVFELELQSLSENGCLVRGSPLPEDRGPLELVIEMPWGERIEVPAICSYREGERQGLVFHGITLGARRRLAKQVLKLIERI